MYVRDRVALEELERIERKEPKARRAKRLRIVILAMRGWPAPSIAMSTGLSRRACQDWVRRFNEAGLPGLEDRHGGGRSDPLTPEQQDRLRERLDAGPVPGDDVCSLRGADIKRILAEEFQICDHCRPSTICSITWDTRTCGRDRAIASPIHKPRQSSRSNSRNGWRRSPRLTQGVVYASIFKMNPVLANKAPRPTSGHPRAHVRQPYAKRNTSTYG